MDKKTLLAIVLIGLIWLMWQPYLEMIGTVPPQQELIDTVQNITRQNDPIESDQEPVVVSKEADQPDTILGQVHESKTVHISNQKFAATFNTGSGGRFTSWRLFAYLDHDSKATVELIEPNSGTLQLNLKNQLGTELDFSKFTWLYDGDTLVSVNDDTARLDFFMNLGNGQKATMNLMIPPNSYSCEVSYNFENIRGFETGDSYTLSWMGGIKTTEAEKEEHMYSLGFSQMAGETEMLDANDDEKPTHQEARGTVDWAAIRTKYFVLSLIPEGKHCKMIEITGTQVKTGEESFKKIYDFSLISDYPSGHETRAYRMYVGPMETEELEQLNAGLEQLVLNTGWYDRMFRVVGLVIMPILSTMYTVIPNYGLVIIIFSILIKVVLYPLSRKQVESTKKMAKIQPQLNELREKYKNDMQKMNAEQQKLFKKHGVNPLGSCLPMLLQMPLLIALYSVFRSAIILRGQPFFGWITDLSRPDSILMLPFSVPLYGDSVNILPLVMGATQFLSAKATTVDPKQKAMVMFMPAFMVLIFNNFPSGLTLYYTMYNILSFAEQKWVRKT